FNKYGKEGMTAKAMEQERAKLREKMAGVEKHLAMKTPAPAKKALSPGDLKLGDSVKVLSLNLKGTVSSLPNAKGDLFVQMGILRSQVNIKDLEKLDEEEIHAPGLKKTGSGKIRMSKSATVGTE